MMKMKVFTDEFEDKLVSIIGYGTLIGIALLIIGLVGYVEGGL